MSDRIKKIKIKQADGTYSDYIPIGADARNIDFQYNGTNIETTLKKKPYYYENVEKMKDVKDIDDLKELLAEEYNGMEVPYKFEKIEK